jgi:hypothetical protein
MVMEIDRDRKRIQTLIQEIDLYIRGGNSKPILVDHLSRYLCVRLSGFLEEGITHILSQYTLTHSNKFVWKFVDRRLDEFQNPKFDRIRQVIESFNEDWWRELEPKLLPYQMQIDSIINIRNSIAHGEDMGVTLPTVKDYFKVAVVVLEEIEKVILK